MTRAEPPRPLAVARSCIHEPAIENRWVLLIRLRSTFVPATRFQVSRVRDAAQHSHKLFVATLEMLSGSFGQGFPTLSWAGVPLASLVNFHDFPSSSFFDLLQRRGAVCYVDWRAKMSPSVGYSQWQRQVCCRFLEKTAESRMGEWPQRVFRALASKGHSGGDQFACQGTWEVLQSLAKWRHQVAGALLAVHRARAPSSPTVPWNVGIAPPTCTRSLTTLHAPKVSSSVQVKGGANPGGFSRFLATCGHHAARWVLVHPSTTLRRMSLNSSCCRVSPKLSASPDF